MTTSELSISFIVPVYNRPEEMDELLDSLSHQTDLDFEVVVVEDGSSNRADYICDKYRGKLNIEYFYKENTGPGISRNYGVERAKGNYCIFVDSDCIIPREYVAHVRSFLTKNRVDVFGGPDAAHADFTNLQKAINYAMTSFFTTGGIRGSSERMEKFHPRSFNMGISKAVYNQTGGFPNVQFAYAKAAGEDLDYSIQIIKKGFVTALISEAFVYHKRRTSMRQFMRQVYNFGIARISVSRRHPESLKIVHFAPAIFVLGLMLLLILSITLSLKFMLPVFLYATLIFLDATIRNKSLVIGFLSVVTSFIQLLAYGLGFLKAFIIQRALKKEMFQD